MQSVDTSTSRISVQCSNPHNFVKKCGLLRHPCIPNAVEVENNQQIKFTLPVLSSLLSEKLQANACNADAAKRMLFQLGSALYHIHSRKIVLQNIQPETIYFNDTTFVFANISQASFIGTGDVKYNLTREQQPFLAPESLDYKMFSTKSDIFSLGLISACMVGSIKNYNTLARKELMHQAFTAIGTMHHVVHCLSDNQHSRPTAEELSKYFANDAFRLPDLAPDMYFAAIDSVTTAGADYEILNDFHHRVFEFIPCFLIEFTLQMTQLHGQFRKKIAPRIESFLKFCVDVKSNQPLYNLFLFVEKNDVEHLENFFIFSFGVQYENAKILFQDCVQLGLINIDEFFIEKIITSGTFATDTKIEVLKLCLPFCAKSGTVKLVSAFLEEVDNMQLVICKLQTQEQASNSDLQETKRLHSAEVQTNKALQAQITDLKNSLQEERKRKTQETAALQEENTKLKAKISHIFEAIKQVDFNT